MRQLQRNINKALRIGLGDQGKDEKQKLYLSDLR